MFRFLHRRSLKYITKSCSKIELEITGLYIFVKRFKKRHIAIKNGKTIPIIVFANGRTIKITVKPF